MTRQGGNYQNPQKCSFQVLELNHTHLAVTCSDFLSIKWTIMDVFVECKPSISRKRLNDGTVKEYKYARSCRKTVEFTFPQDKEKLVFDQKLESLKSATGCKTAQDALKKAIDFSLSYYGQQG